MSVRKVFNTLYCREASICDQSAIASYNTSSPHIPVGQIVAARPLTTFCNSFSFVIVNPGNRGCISIGLVHRHYPANRQPGWDAMSIAYHADDGGIFHEHGYPIQNVGAVGAGGVMTCTLNFNDQSVTFYRNNIQVYKSNRLHFPPGGFYPVIGFHSYGESVCILDRDPWLPSTDQVDQIEVVYHSLYCRELDINHTTGMLSYSSTSPDVPVGQFIAARPLTPNCNRFSLVIVNPGTKGCIAIGLCHRHYPAHRQPGWDVMSIAYHADDGKIYSGAGSSRTMAAKAKVGEVMGCQYNFRNNTVIFTKNGQQVYKTGVMRMPVGGFYPVIGMHSFGEVVQLLERPVWQAPQDEVHEHQPMQQTSQQIEYHTLVCREATIDHEHGYIRYNSAEPGCPVAQVIAKNPLTPACNKFSMVIIKPGSKRCMTIGLCHRNYPADNQPGWRSSSIAYHADDGGIFIEDGHPYVCVQAAYEGDTMTCELTFPANIATFYLNNTIVYQSRPQVAPPGGFHPVVGLHSYGEVVKLVEQPPWSATAHTDLRASGQQNTTELVVEAPRVPVAAVGAGLTQDTDGGGESCRLPVCGICMENPVNRFLNPCGHTFCYDCVQDWQQRKKECPTCRNNFIDSKPLYF